jgi:ParB-like chromosome segregation protein Spo0J
MAAGECLPPVELHKLGRGYYVVDGHYRIAAALLLGQADVDAIVVEHYIAQGGTMSEE